MRAVPAPFPALGADCVSTLTAESAQGLYDAGIRFAMRYLGGLTSAELQAILSAGLLVGLVTYADVFDGPRAVAELRELAIPAGVVVWLDIEGIGPDTSADRVTASVNAWAAAVSSAGYVPGLYVGANACLTSPQLYALDVVRYWRSASLVPEPACGYCLTQLSPTITLAGISIDVDVVGHDYRGRAPTFVGPLPSAVSTQPDPA